MLLPQRDLCRVRQRSEFNIVMESVRDLFYEPIALRNSTND
jgi:hypothetical protein